MKNKISDLRNHMFAALERLGDADLTEDQIRVEIQKAQAVSELGKVIVDSAKTEVMFMKLTGKGVEKETGFLEDDTAKDFIRPKAEYSNPQHLKAS